MNIEEKTMREQFEKMSEIAEIAKPHRMVFSKEKNKYLSTDSCFYNETSYVNGAWYAFQERQKRIETVFQKNGRHGYG